MDLVLVYRYHEHIFVRKRAAALCPPALSQSHVLAIALRLHAQISQFQIQRQD